MTVALSLAAMVLLGLAFWIRAAGSAIARVPRADALRDEATGQAGAGVVADLLDEREVITPAVGVAASLLLIFGPVLATVLAVQGLPIDQGVVAGLLIAVAAFLTGDLVPRQIGRWNPHRVAYRSAKLLTWAVHLGGWASDLLAEPEADDQVAEEDSDEQERELIDSVLEFGETIVREVMTPRPDMVTISVTSSVDELIDLSSEEGFSRIPVTANGDIVGLVIIKDLIPMLADEVRPGLTEVMRPVDFVPETKLASALLPEMQGSHTHQVIVIDEYGDIAGLVTIEDLLEELVGEIADETDFEEELILKNGAKWEVDARLSVDDLGDAVGVDLPDEWDTVGGLVLALAERVPEAGESFEFEGLRLTVTKMQGRRVSEVAVVIIGHLSDA